LVAEQYGAARGQQMPTLVTKYSPWDKKGQIELESFIVTQKGRAGMDDDVLDVSNGDFKFNLKLTRDGKQEAVKKEQGHDDADILWMFSSRFKRRLQSYLWVTIFIKLWGLARTSMCETFFML
jgi:hypothetical protein